MADLETQLNRFLTCRPKLGAGTYIAKGGVVVGDVVLGDHSSVWYNAVVRGDINFIRIGHHTNIQDNAVIHLADDYPCILGDYVTVGHSAVIHACTIANECLIGMGAVILDGAEVGEQSIVGAKTLVTQGMKIPPGSLVVGAPAKVKRPLTREEREDLKNWAIKYVYNAAYCLKNGLHVSQPLSS